MQNARLNLWSICFFFQKKLYSTVFTFVHVASITNHVNCVDDLVTAVVSAAFPRSCCAYQEYAFSVSILAFTHIVIFSSSKHTIFSVFTSSHLHICIYDLHIFTSAHIIFTSPLLSSSHLQRFRSTRIILTFFIFACLHIIIFKSSSSLSISCSFISTLRFHWTNTSYIHFSPYSSTLSGHASSDFLHASGFSEICPAASPNSGI